MKNFILSFKKTFANIKIILFGKIYNNIKIKVSYDSS